MKENTEFDHAMEALEGYKALSSLTESVELLCECCPTPYGKFMKYLETYSGDKKDFENILKTFSVAQGCGSCRREAINLIKLSLKTLGESNDA